MGTEKRQPYIAHVLAVSYPSQGHINPMLQFCKRLVSKNLKTTLAITNFISNSTKFSKSNTVQIDTISDGFDEGGYIQAKDVNDYLKNLEIAGRETLAGLIKKHETSGQPINCVLYDAFMPWALDVAKDFGLFSATFFTQPCSVNFVYYYIYNGLLKVPGLEYPVVIPGLPLLDRLDMPSFVAVVGSYPPYFELVLNQFLKAEKADFVLVNSFYKLEEQVVDTMSKVFPHLTIGPTLPSFYLDNRVENDRDYGLSLFDDSDASTTTDWLKNKPKGSIVYVSFGSMASLEEKQMHELAWGLTQSNFQFLWVIRSSNEESKLPRDFQQHISLKGILVKWSSQLEVLSSESIGCFFTHCGWNSTIEALSLGVPMVGMPQWTGQPMNAKLIEDVWKVGIRVKVDEKLGLVGKDEIALCIKEVMEGEKGKEMKRNALRWKNLAKEAVNEGGTSDKSIDEFVSIFKKH